MIRPITQDDWGAVISLAVTSGLFSEKETQIVEKLLTDYFAGNRDSGHMCIIDEEVAPLGVAYYEPAPATDGSWYLTMIGVRRDAQGQGRGAALIQYVENALLMRDQRLLLVETSSLPDYSLTRKFYAKCGYEEEARIRDYWEEGNDMVLFRKALIASPE